MSAAGYAGGDEPTTEEGDASSPSDERNGAVEDELDGCDETECVAQHPPLDDLCPARWGACRDRACKCVDMLLRPSLSDP